MKIGATHGFGEENFDDPIKHKMLPCYWFLTINMEHSRFTWYRWNKTEYLDVNALLYYPAHYRTQ